MILKIKTTGEVICNDLKTCESFIGRMLGLLLPANPRNLLFKTRFGIHTFFLKEVIDVIVLNYQYKVVQIKTNLKPYRLFFWNPKYFIVLELRAGTIDKFHIKTGQILKIA